jgi:DNA-binding transcriptional regulator YiaG
MPNIATVLKEEITRLARKELRGVLASLKKSSAQHRTDIASLRRRIKELEGQAGRVSSRVPIKAERPSSNKPVKAVRFGAKGFVAQRKRLGLSAAELGILLNCSAQSIYKWEQGETRPRARQMPAIVALRGLSKAQAAEVLRHALAAGA